MNVARAGAYFERRVRRQLEQDGWFVVRVAGSRGVCDLIALRPGDARLIQVRRNGRMSTAERDVLARTAWYAGATPWLARRGDHFAVVLDALPVFAERDTHARADA